MSVGAAPQPGAVENECRPNMTAWPWTESRSVFLEGTTSGCAEMARALTVVTTIGRYARCSLRAASTLVARVNGIAAVIAAIEITTSEAANIINGSSAEMPKTTLLSQCDAENPATTPKAIPRTINFEA